MKHYFSVPQPYLKIFLALTYMSGGWLQVSHLNNNQVCQPLNKTQSFSSLPAFQQNPIFSNLFSLYDSYLNNKKLRTAAPHKYPLIFT